VPPPPGPSPVPDGFTAAPAPPPAYASPAYTAPPAYGTAPAFGPPAAPGKPPVRVWDLIITIILLVIDIVIAGFASLAGMFLVMGADACGVRDCSTDLIVLGWLVGMILPWVALIVTAIVAIVFLLKRRITFWVPIVGAGLIIGSVILGFTITAAGAT
jgi:uncharacterized BrkB/YihY/UPF0761 family membrane protein